MTQQPQPKLYCPWCQHLYSKVVDSRPAKVEGVWRRRECLRCRKRFTTEEIVMGKYGETTSPQDVVKARLS